LTVPVMTREAAPPGIKFSVNLMPSCPIPCEAASTNTAKGIAQRQRIVAHLRHKILPFNLATKADKAKRTIARV
jgi:hypothetical protein